MRSPPPPSSCSRSRQPLAPNRPRPWPRRRPDRLPWRGLDIPAEVRLGIDARAIDAGSLDRLSAALAAAAAALGARRDLAVELTLTRDGSPVELDADLVDAALAEADRLGVPAQRTWSGAGHDAQHLTALAPALLLFVPLHDGESHTPAEGADLDECLDAARIAGGVLRGVQASLYERPLWIETVIFTSSIPTGRSRPGWRCSRAGTSATRPRRSCARPA